MKLINISFYLSFRSVILYLNKNYCLSTYPKFYFCDPADHAAPDRGVTLYKLTLPLINTIINWTRFIWLEESMAKRSLIWIYPQKCWRLLLKIWNREVLKKNASSYYIWAPLKYPWIKLDGTLYFVEGTGLGPDFGFPRVEGKKKFRWKKMNFSTNLPKTNPRVTYIVASTTNCHQISEN